MKSTYEIIPSDEQSESERNKPRERTYYYARQFSKAAICLFAIFGAGVAIQFIVSRLAGESSDCTCGQTPAEAVARGCRFDPFELQWLPDACRDDGLIETYRQWGNSQQYDWLFAAAESDVRQLDFDAVSMLSVYPLEQSHIFASDDWHVMHCLYIIQKKYLHVHRGLWRNRNTDSDVHLTHCFAQLMHRIRPEPRDPVDNRTDSGRAATSMH